MRQRYEEQERPGRRRHNGGYQHGMGWQEEDEERRGVRRGQYEGSGRGEEQREFGERDFETGERYGQPQRGGWEEEERSEQRRGAYRQQGGEGDWGSEEYGRGEYGEGGYAEQGFERQRGEGGRSAYGRREGSQRGGERVGYGSSSRGYASRSRWEQGYGSPHHGLGGPGQYGGEYGSRSGMRGGYGGESGRYGAYRGAEDYEPDYGREPWRRSEQRLGRRGGGQSFRGRGPQNYRRSDERIREEICDRLTDDDAIDATHIEVVVSGGEVTLTGTVDDRESKRTAEDVAESISGVQNVQNQLRVARPDNQQRGHTGTSQSSTGEAGGTRTASGSSRSDMTGGSESDKTRKS